MRDTAPDDQPPPSGPPHASSPQDRPGYGEPLDLTTDGDATGGDAVDGDAADGDAVDGDAAVPGTGMRRRGATVLVGAVLVALLSYLTFQAQVPYVELQPGPTYDTLGRDTDGKPVIVVSGVPETESAGQLRFLTVVVQPNLTLLQALIGWWNDENAVVPRELIYPPDESPQEVDRRNAEDFANSESAAQTAAMLELGYPLKITVKEVAAGGPSDGKLRAGDVIKSINGTPVDARQRLLELIRTPPPGTSLDIGIVRDGSPKVVKVITAASAEDGVPRIGITPEATATAPFTVKIPIENIGGPSAGLMLTLGIIDKVKTEDLTGGKIIAGTGTIDELGRVGPIGGVPQKLVGARDAGAQFFLTPVGNCAEAVANQISGLPLVRVGSVDEALAALADIRAGRTPPLCPR